MRFSASCMMIVLPFGPSVVGQSSQDVVALQKTCDRDYADAHREPIACGKQVDAQSLTLRRGAADIAQPIVFDVAYQGPLPISRGKVMLQPGVERLEISGALEAQGSDLPTRPRTDLEEPSPDWTNFGGTPGRDGRSSATGPGAARLLWAGGRPSIIAWLPVVHAGRMFTVRQTAGPSGEPNASPLVATDLETGGELWVRNLPFNSGDWTTWIAGARDGRVYASRSGNGASVAARMYALDAATGSTVWASGDTTTAGAYDGVVFAPDGDLIVSSFRRLIRLNAEDGTTVWSVPRGCRVSGNCGAVLHGDAIYIAEGATASSNVVVRYDLATGERLYQSPQLPGVGLQDAPFVGADGTVFLAHTRGDPATDYLYAFTDTGTALISKWQVPAPWMVTSVQAVGPDGSVYTMTPDYHLVRRDGATGVVVATATGKARFDQHVRMALAADGKLYVSEGWSVGVRAFDADLNALWKLAVPNINIGGPALAQSSVGGAGRLVVTGIGNDVRAIVPVELLTFVVE